jgi:predicted alpha/beta superfamily hydrolase
METSPLLPAVVLHEVPSSILDQDLQPYVKLPWSYKRSENGYPVLYCLDANRSFPVYSTTSLIYETPGANSQEIVIIGIGYKVDSDRIRVLICCAQ